ncbi:MAG: OmpH family outer membrane protein [Gammaproteobacteria bacterium]|nr:OmpH family outer membrane protein [Gammaproteobacteria bacterium]
MKRHVVFAVLGALALASAASAAEIKIGTVQTAVILQQAPQFADAQQKMKAEFGKRGEALQKQEQQLTEDAKAYQRNADIMTPDDREKKEKDLRNRQIDLQYAEQKFKPDVAKRNTELNQELETQVHAVIEAVAKAKGLDLVIADPLYASNAVDVTQDVVKKLKTTGAGSGK